MASSSEILRLFPDPVDLQNIIDQLPIGVALLDMKRRILLINRTLQALTGFSQEDAAGVPCHHILRLRICVQGCPASGLQGLTTSAPPAVQTDMINAQRQLIPVRLTAALVRDSGGSAVGFMEIIEDLRPFEEIEHKRSQAFRVGGMIGKSLQMERIFQVLPLLAQNDSSILITGETGTGKDLLAETIHHASARAKGPFVKVNCSALPETLLESELFGHQKGAFTGAVENKPGRFRLAHHGTLYLTEIGDLPYSTQVKLLTFLDDRLIYPLGSTKGFQADVRVIAATHRNLEKMVREARFREDLFFRLNVVRIELPPLRERGDDIRLLIDHFLDVFSKRLGKNIKGFTDRAIGILESYTYPGNIRELRNIVEYAVTMTTGRRVSPKHLPSYLTELKPENMTPEMAVENGATADRSIPPGSSGVQAAVPDEWPAAEKKMILEALIRARGRRSEAARILGWGRSTLWRKMKTHGIDA
jgi:transcriptional regulator with PAS, ATPase and Fis domain